VFFFGTFHVLILYAWNRIAGILEFDEAVYEEIQRRDALVPPAQRQATIDALGKVNFSGVTGPVAFDQYGDTVSRVLTVYKVTDLKWVPVLTEAFK